MYYYLYSFCHCCVLTLAEFHMPTQSCSITPLLGCTGETKTERLVDQNTGKASPNTITGTMEPAWGSYINLLPVKSQKDLPSPFPTSSWLSFTPDFSTSSLPVAGQGMGAVLSSSHIAPATPVSKGRGLLRLSPRSSVGPSHRRQSLRSRVL